MRSRASSRGKRSSKLLEAVRDTPGEVADALEIDSETETSEKLASLIFADLRDGLGSRRRSGAQCGRVPSRSRGPPAEPIFGAALDESRERYKWRPWLRGKRLARWP